MARPAKAISGSGNRSGRFAGSFLLGGLLAGWLGNKQFVAPDLHRRLGRAS